MSALNDLRRLLPVCPYCGLPIDPGARSRDHVMPRARGGMLGDGGKRIVHHACNNLRNSAGECVGALACALAVADTLVAPRKRSARVRYVLRAWRLQIGSREPGEKQRAVVAAMRSAHLGLPVVVPGLRHLTPAVLDAAGRVRPRPRVRRATGAVEARECP